jgi:two-component system nitrogen regulation response regulator NtrX
VDQGRFREDLFFRLNVVPITSPPLRHRRDDIPLLVHHFIQMFAEENGTPPKEVPLETLDALGIYPWPGNIRELRNTIERLCIMVPGGTIRSHDLDLKSSESGDDRSKDLPSGKTLREVREIVERRYISGALERCGWNVTQAARDLGIERTNLHKKIKAYELERHASGRKM